MVLAGGLSNLYDRLRYGYVIDFLELDVFRFPVFNVADVCIVAGCALALIAIVRADGGKKAWLKSFPGGSPLRTPASAWTPT